MLHHVFRHFPLLVTPLQSGTVPKLSKSDPTEPDVMHRMMTVQAASPQTEPAWREVMQQLAPLPSQGINPQGVTMYDYKTDSGLDGSAVGGVPSFQSGAVAATSLDICGAASARVMWSAAAGAAAMHAAAAVARGDGPQPDSPVAGSVSEQELADRARHLLSAVRQVSSTAVVSCRTREGRRRSTL